ncbi:MAG: hypothetical protein Q7S74_01645 [Nanoarchaeota archaeon]|nr:hypothetical protein [Nanoarchaeota archaeon]
MKLRKCSEHMYTMKENCSQCKKDTKDAHYKFVKLRNANSMLVSSDKLHAME